MDSEFQMKYCFISLLQLAKRRYNTSHAKKRRKDAVVLQKASWASGVIVWMEMSRQGLTKQFLVEPKAKIDAEKYQDKVLKHRIKESKRL
ncbi:hypothetical protein TNCV_2339561 [Trichonephila clavipes]|nr:hypothetical protein TNCV_2339561 [Trichonephila clavipes]